MVSYSKAQYNNSGAVLTEDGKTPVAWWPALSGRRAGHASWPLGFLGAHLDLRKHDAF